MLNRTAFSVFEPCPRHGLTVFDESKRVRHVSATCPCPTCTRYGHAPVLCLSMLHRFKPLQISLLSWNAHISTLSIHAYSNSNAHAHGYNNYVIWDHITIMWYDPYLASIIEQCQRYNRNGDIIKIWWQYHLMFQVFDTLSTLEFRISRQQWMVAFNILLYDVISKC